MTEPGYDPRSMGGPDAAGWAMDPPPELTLSAKERQYHEDQPDQGIGVGTPSLPHAAGWGHCKYFLRVFVLGTG